MIRLTLTILVLLTAGCAVTPVDEQYYVLGTSHPLNASQMSTAITADSKPIIILQTVDVADYLLQQSLIMQINDHQLQKAYYHYWAEDLRQAISRELLNDLRANSTQFNFESSSGRFIGRYQLDLYVKIDQFHPSDRSDVTVAGQYWLVNQDHQETIASNNFFFQSPLEADGFAQAVKQLRVLVGELARDIAASIQ